MGPPGWDAIGTALSGRVAGHVDEPGLKRAAVAVILRDGASAIEILFIRRAEHPGDPWSGQTAFPGGRSEPGDGELRVTAMRETAEEIGLELGQEADYLGPLDEVRAMARMRPLNLAISPFVFRHRGQASLRLSSEVTSVHWLPLTELMGARWRSVHDYEHQGVKLAFPCIRYDGLVIWGLTYRMFTSFCEIVGGATD